VSTSSGVFLPVFWLTCLSSNLTGCPHSLHDDDNDDILIFLNNSPPAAVLIVLVVDDFGCRYTCPCFFRTCENMIFDKMSIASQPTIAAYPDIMNILFDTIITTTTTNTSGI
jgi:hypothetical protein